MHHLERRLGRGHRVKDAVGHVRFEQGGAHPARPQRADTAVTLPQVVAELVPQTRRQVEIAVRGAYALGREHASQHGSLLDDERLHALPRRGDGGRRAGGRAADDEHVGPAADGVFTGAARGERQTQQGRNQDFFHRIGVFSGAANLTAHPPPEAMLTVSVSAAVTGRSS